MTSFRFFRRFFHHDDDLSHKLDPQLFKRTKQQINDMKQRENKNIIIDMKRFEYELNIAVANNNIKTCGEILDVMKIRVAQLPRSDRQIWRNKIKDVQIHLLNQI